MSINCYNGFMLITLTGENLYLLMAELKALTDIFARDNGPLSVENIDAEESEPEKISEALTGLDLFAPKKLVVIRGGSKNKLFSEAIEQVLESMPDSTDAIFVEPYIDKRLSFYKILKQRTDLKEYKKLDQRGLAEWAVNKAGKIGGNLSIGDAMYLIERAGLDQQNLNNELEKLVLYDKKITREKIELLIEPTPQSTIFQLLEAAFSGNKNKAIKLFKEQREMKVEPQQIIAMISWQLNLLALVMAAGQRSSDNIASDARLNPYAVSKTQAIARKLNSGRLEELVNGLLEIDTRSKRKSIDLDSALERYLLTL